jgi:hypothetical protein
MTRVVVHERDCRLVVRADDDDAVELRVPGDRRFPERVMRLPRARARELGFLLLKLVEETRH